MQLSQRLEKLIGLAGNGLCAADIGTDHGMVPIELVRRGAFDRAIASDVRKGPLAAASAHVRVAGLSDRIDLRLGDGLQVLTSGEADVILISGMGGALMQRILTEGEAAAKTAKRLVLSPQSEIPAFRSFLQESGYAVTGEAIVCEDRKFYFLMTAEPGGQEVWEGADRLYGRYLLEEGGETVTAYVKKRKAVLRRILRSLEKAGDPKAEDRRREAEEELCLTEEALLRLASTQR
ncbi:MAG: SAM-dependent methyltransferase [Lachnospiraceae bacterium]|nr:SAM-dependent methyltransferase [Lachnospiraceae bacterium]